MVDRLVPVDEYRAAEAPAESRQRRQLQRHGLAQEVVRQRAPGLHHEQHFKDGRVHERAQSAHAPYDVVLEQGIVAFADRVHDVGDEYVDGEYEDADRKPPRMAVKIGVFG